AVLRASGQRAIGTASRAGHNRNADAFGRRGADDDRPVVNVVLDGGNDRRVAGAPAEGNYRAMALDRPLDGFGISQQVHRVAPDRVLGVYFALSQPARVHLRRPGPWLALVIFAMCTLPVLIWNARHSWVALHHLWTNARLDKDWKPTPDYIGDFFLTETGLLNPVFFLASLWAMLKMWKGERTQPLLKYFFSMGAPVFLGYWLLTLRTRVHSNWIVCAVVPMFCLMAVYWELRWREGARGVKVWLVTALVLGF